MLLVVATMTAAPAYAALVADKSVSDLVNAAEVIVAGQLTSAPSETGPFLVEVVRVLKGLGRPISKVYQADPLVCQKCGGPLKIVAYVTDELSITRILDHLGLSPPRQDKPPPTRELVRVPVDDERREIEAY